MRREEFIKEIEENLSGKMTAKEIQDVVYDYNEYFDVGIREGRLEEDLCEQWGSPAKIAKTLFEEGNTNNRINIAALSVANKLGETIEKKEDCAPLPNRMIAFFIDTIIAGLPLMLLTRVFFGFLLMQFMPVMILGIAGWTMYTHSPGAAQLRAICGILAVAFCYLYQPICLFLLQGQTIGKLFMKIKVVRQDGSRLTLTNIFAREVLGKLLLNTLSFGIASLISFVWALISKEHKTVHDVIGGTRVVNISEVYQKRQ